VCGVDSSGPICGSVVGCCGHVEVLKMQETSSLGEDLLVLWKDSALWSNLFDWC
jgi:hypothetical protein